MITTTIDTLCRRILLRKRLPLHYYIDCLLAAVDSLSILTTDDLQIVNVKSYLVNEYNAVQIDGNVADIVEVSVGVGQSTRQLTPHNRINSLNNFDSNFNISDFTTDSGWGYGNYTGAEYNSYGEYQGGRFGVGGGGTRDTYKIILGRNEIQFNEAIEGNVIVAFIDDGRNADAASHVEVAAEDCITAYILWQLAEMSRASSMGEKERLRQMYIEQRKILRSRKADWSIARLKRIISKNARASI
jgi:hypothetical protein